MQSVITNGLVVWGPEELRLRRMIFDVVVAGLTKAAQETNRAWQMHQIEYPVLMPTNDMNAAYTADDIFILSNADTEWGPTGLRPETTYGSYQYALDYTVATGRRQALPLCVYQMGLSFRNEQDKTLKHMRLKQFNQLEFQFIYDDTSKADYPQILRDAAFNILSGLFRGPNIEVEPSDRLPAYSTRTDDLVIVNKDGYRMEVCSMSERTDCPIPNTKNFEIAFGIDRLVHQYGMREW